LVNEEEVIKQLNEEEVNEEKVNEEVSNV